MLQRAVNHRWDSPSGSSKNRALRRNQIGDKGDCGGDRVDRVLTGFRGLDAWNRTYLDFEGASSADMDLLLEVRN